MTANVIQRAIAAGFKALPALGVAEMALYCPLTWRPTGALPSDDPADGAQRFAITFARYTLDEMRNSGILPKDEKAVFPTLFYRGECRIGDAILRADGKRWVVQQARTDAAKAVWVLQVRTGGG
jgi:hypothetical protein